MEIRDSVLSMLQEISGKDDFPLTDDMMLGEDLDLDSLDMIQLGMDLETRFGIRIPDDFLPEDPTVGQVVDFVDRSFGGAMHGD